MAAVIPRLLLSLVLLGPAGAAVAPGRTPVSRTEDIVLAAGSLPDWRYLAFPALVDLGDEILASFKRARSHAQDPGAGLDLLRLDPATGRRRAHAPLARVEGQILQMGEWVRFPDGSLANFIDAQEPGRATTRTGLRVIRSADGGRTFGALERVGPVDGVEYGYAFDALSEGPTTWLLAMTFANLTGGQSVTAARPLAGSVDVLRSDDSGRSWHRVRALSAEFGGIAINESALLRDGVGFLVTTRGYDNRQRLHRTDGEFRLLRQSDLSAPPTEVTSYIGRPRLFRRDGRAYLLGRNVSAPGRPMELALLRLDAAGLRVDARVVLDNAEAGPVTDGYYAMPWFRGAGDDAVLHVLTYRGRERRPPDLVHLSFRWGEIR